MKDLIIITHYIGLSTGETIMTKKEVKNYRPLYRAVYNVREKVIYRLVNLIAHYIGLSTKMKINEALRKQRLIAHYIGLSTLKEL